MENGILSRVRSAFQILSDTEFTKHKIFMTEGYLTRFVVKSTSMMTNDRSCYGKELKRFFVTQELIKFRRFCQNKSTTLPGSIPQRKFIHDIFFACLNI